MLILRLLKTSESGQVMGEYVIALVFFALLAVAALTLAHYFSLYGVKLVDFVSVEYP